MSFIKEIVFVVYETKKQLMKQSVMQRLDGMNIIIQLKVQNYWNTFETISTTGLHGLLFQMFQKMLRHGVLRV